MHYIGIDPGLHGAIAVYDAEEHVVTIHDMPIRRITVNGKKRNRLDLVELSEILKGYSVGDRVLVEAVHAMPKQGVTSSFSFGFVFGAICQAVTCELWGEPGLVSPQVWKRHYGLTADKNSARAKAAEIFPAQASLFARKKDDGRAESSLIALYGWEMSKTR